MARSYEEQKHESCVGASLLAISNPAESMDREQARSYEEQKHQSRVGASLLAIATLRNPRIAGMARSYEEQKHQPQERATPAIRAHGALLQVLSVLI